MGPGEEGARGGARGKEGRREEGEEARRGGRGRGGGGGGRGAGRGGSWAGLLQQRIMGWKSSNPGTRTWICSKCFLFILGFETVDLTKRGDRGKAGAFTLHRGSPSAPGGVGEGEERAGG